MFTTLVAIVSLWIAAVSSESCQTNTHVDGCSIPLGIHLFYQDTFTPSCNRHDICYYCADYYGKNKTDCDTAFYHDMLNACGNLQKRFIVPDVLRCGNLQKRFKVPDVLRCGNLQKRFIVPDVLRCKAAAYTYYEAVKGFADSHFEKVSPLWCHTAWTRTCLP